VKTFLLRLITGYVAIWGCVIVGTLAWVPVVDRLGLGRDFRLMGVTAGLLLLVLGTLARRHLGWRIWEFLANAAAAEATLLLAISHFSGFTGTELLHSFNLEWWVFLSRFVGLPWLAGYIVGCVWPKGRGASRRRTTASSGSADRSGSR
jgi:hypothetical protein